MNFDVQKAIKDTVYSGRENEVSEQFKGELVRLSATKLTVDVPAREGDIYVDTIDGVEHTTELTKESAIGKTIQVRKIGVAVKCNINGVSHTFSGLIFENAIDALATAQGVGNMVYLTVRQRALLEDYTSKHLDKDGKPIVHKAGEVFTDLVSLVGIRDIKTYTIA